MKAKQETCYCGRRIVVAHSLLSVNYESVDSLQWKRSRRRRRWSEGGNTSEQCRPRANEETSST